MHLCALIATLLPQLLLLLGVIAPAVQGQTDPGDTAALLKIKDSFEQLDFLDSWVVGSDPCGTDGNSAWSGIACDCFDIPAYPPAVNVDGAVNNCSGVKGARVTHLDFGVTRPGRTRLVGTINPAIGDLEELRVVNFQGNKEGLTGTLPSDMSKLKNLEVLFVGDTSLTGQLPDWLADIPNFLAASMVKTMLNGSIPRNWWQGDTTLPFQVRLELSENPGLCGTVPPEIMWSIAYSKTEMFYSSEVNVTGTPFENDTEVALTEYCCNAGRPQCHMQAGCMFKLPRFLNQRNAVTFNFTAFELGPAEQLENLTEQILGSYEFHIGDNFANPNDAWYPLDLKLLKPPLKNADWTLKEHENAINEHSVFQYFASSDNFSFNLGEEMNVQLRARGSFCPSTYKMEFNETMVAWDPPRTSNEIIATYFQVESSLSINWEPFLDSALGTLIPDAGNCYFADSPCAYYWQLFESRFDAPSDDTEVVLLNVKCQDSISVNGSYELQVAQLHARTALAPVPMTDYDDGRFSVNVDSLSLDSGRSYYAVVLAVNAAGLSACAGTKIRWTEEDADHTVLYVGIALGFMAAILAAASALTTFWYFWQHKRQAEREKHLQALRDCMYQWLPPLVDFNGRSFDGDQSGGGSLQFLGTGELAVVITDLQDSTPMAAADEVGYHLVQQLHDDVLRENLQRFGGYEINTEGDSFHIAFPTVAAAVSFCCACQYQLHETNWPSRVLKMPSCKKVTHEGELVFNGPRVRMGVHWATKGTIGARQHQLTRHWVFSGPGFMIAQEVGDAGAGGQVVITDSAWQQLRGDMAAAGHPTVCQLGLFKLQSWTQPMWLYEVQQQLGRPLFRSFPPLRKVDRVAAGFGFNITPPPAPPPGIKDPHFAFVGATVDQSAMTVSPAQLPWLAPLLARSLSVMAQQAGGYLSHADARGLHYMLAFASTQDALHFCASTQIALLYERWPGDVAEQLGATEKGLDDKLIFRGPRLSMGLVQSNEFRVRPVADGSKATAALAWQDVTFGGRGPKLAAAIARCAHGGQLVLNEAAWRAVKDKLAGNDQALSLGTHVVSASFPQEQLLLEVVLQRRSFPPLRSAACLSPGYRDSPDPARDVAIVFVTTVKPAEVAAATRMEGAMSDERMLATLTAYLKGVTAVGASLRRLLREHGGYECKEPAPGKFTLAFSDLGAALRCCTALQVELTQLPWPEEVLKWEESREQRVGDDNGDGKRGGELLWRGLRVRVGIAYGHADHRKPLTTGRADYYGSLPNLAARVCSLAAPGQVLVEAHGLAAFPMLPIPGQAALSSARGSSRNELAPRCERRYLGPWPTCDDTVHLEPLGPYKLKGFDDERWVYAAVPAQLHARFRETYGHIKAGEGSATGSQGPRSLFGPSPREVFSRVSARRSQYFGLAIHTPSAAASDSATCGCWQSGPLAALLRGNGLRRRRGAGSSAAARKPKAMPSDLQLLQEMQATSFAWSDAASRSASRAKMQPRSSGHSLRLPPRGSAGAGAALTQPLRRTSSLNALVDGDAGGADTFQGVLRRCSSGPRLEHWREWAESTPPPLPAPLPPPQSAAAASLLNMHSQPSTFSHAGGWPTRDAAAAMAPEAPPLLRRDTMMDVAAMFVSSRTIGNGLESEGSGGNSRSSGAGPQPSDHASSKLEVFQPQLTRIPSASQLQPSTEPSAAGAPGAAGHPSQLPSVSGAAACAPALAVERVACAGAAAAGGGVEGVEGDDDEEAECHMCHPRAASAPAKLLSRHWSAASAALLRSASGAKGSQTGGPDTHAGSTVDALPAVVGKHMLHTLRSMGCVYKPMMQLSGAGAGRVPASLYCNIPDCEFVEQHKLSQQQEPAKPADSKL